VVSELSALRKWREYVSKLVEAIKRVVPSAEVYLVGGAAEGRLTALSDIDVLIALPREPSFEEAVEIRARVWEEAERLGVPLYAPIDLHVVGRNSLERYAKRGKVVKLS